MADTLHDPDEAFGEPNAIFKTIFDRAGVGMAEVVDPDAEVDARCFEGGQPDAAAEGCCVRSRSRPGC